MVYHFPQIAVNDFVSPVDHLGLHKDISVLLAGEIILEVFINESVVWNLVGVER